MEDQDEKKGFAIRDRRFSSQPNETVPEDSARKQEGAEQATATGEGPGQFEPDHPPEIDFSSFVFSLGTSALLHLGEVPDPTTQKRERNLPLAKQTIDILGMLKEKTKGNLSSDEEKLIENLLTDLRWRYVHEVKK
jgi:hypothetical protein